MADYYWAIMENPSPPPPLTPRDIVKVTVAIRSIIRTSLTDEIRADLPVTGSSGPPHEIIKYIGNLFTDITSSVHRRLEAEAVPTQLVTGQKISGYLAKHKLLILRMFLACYPKISDDHTSIRFAVNGLAGNPHYCAAARAIQLSGLSVTLKILEDRLFEE